jgi:ABC-type long-subunit fatty acid transport system fused permease/ATPase subunit
MGKTIVILGLTFLASLCTSIALLSVYVMKQRSIGVLPHEPLIEIVFIGVLWIVGVGWVLIKGIDDLSPKQDKEAITPEEELEAMRHELCVAKDHPNQVATDGPGEYDYYRCPDCGSMWKFSQDTNLRINIR